MARIRLFRIPTSVILVDLENPFIPSSIRGSVSNSRGNPQKAWEVLSVDREASQR